MDELDTTERTRLRRKADRGHFDRATINAILDEGFVCHLGFAIEGRPTVMPTAYARVDDALYLHGAAANAVLRGAALAFEVCVTVTLVDGLVLSRSAFHHSINYRSVLVFGSAVTVEGHDEKHGALVAIVDQVVPGRSAEARLPTAAEVRSTRVLRLPIEEASAKVRTGGPADEPEDLGLPVWAGHVPLHLIAGAPVPDDHVPDGAAVPSYLLSYRRPRP